MQSRGGFSTSGNSYGTMNFGGSGSNSGGPFAFIIGVISLFTSFGLTLYDQNKHEREKEEYRNTGYNQIVQCGRYDGDQCYLREKYDMFKVIDAVKEEYPHMSDVIAYKVAYAAVAKKLMEEETSYKYQVPEELLFLGDIERFAKEELRND